MATATQASSDQSTNGRGRRNHITETSAAATDTPVRSQSLKTSWACLLLAEDANRRQDLANSAIDGGWEPIVCGSVGEAIRQHKRWATQLAAIDLGEMAAVQKAAYLQFAGTMATRERLLIISDEPTGTEGELWARQAGAWVYLPSPDFQDGVADLFAEARMAAEQLTATTPVS
ncbi:MAG: hypothetical protein AAF266_02435 [Planctomycetota bacterium]